jgi:predicted nucleic acid-binding protein
MKYLLDVNALVALGFVQHEFHERINNWLAAEQYPSLFSCPITELGFVRVLSQAASYRFTVPQARNALLALKQTDRLPFGFLEDAQDISHLPSWVRTAKQTTDGHLLQLAKSAGIALATFNSRIPGAYSIP